MPVYEVTYRVGDDIHTALVEAPGPAEAARRFQEERREERVDVLCVVRQ